MRSMVKLEEYPYINKAVVYLFCVYAFIWHFEIGKRVPVLGSLRVEFVLGALLGICALVAISQQPVPKDKEAHTFTGKIPTAIILCLGVLGFGLIFSINIGVSWNLYFNNIVKYAIMALFLRAFAVSPHNLKMFFASIFLVYLKVGQEAFLGKITGSMVWENQGIMRLNGAPGSMFGHPNSLSGKTLSTLPFVYHFFRIVPRFWQALLIVFLIFALNILLFTGSRTGYIAFLFMVVVIVWNSKKRIRAVLMVILIGSIALAYIPDEYKGRFVSAFKGKEAEGASKDTRKGLIRDSWHVFLDNPQGVGIGCFMIVQQREGRNPQPTHNLYTELLSETGMQGFIAFFTMLYLVLKGLRGLKSSFHDKLALLSAFVEGHFCDAATTDVVQKEIKDLVFLENVCSATILYIYVRFILGIFGNDLLELYWWLAAGLALALDQINRVISVRVRQLMGAM